MLRSGGNRMPAAHSGSLSELTTLRIAKINKDTFWTLINQGREQCGQDVHALAQWLEDRLMELGPEQALNFDYIAHAYRAAAYKYGLWNAASIMCDGCTDDGFTDFRGWLIAAIEQAHEHPGRTAPALGRSASRRCPC